MSNKVIDLEHLEANDNLIFFGKFSGFQRFDNPKFQNAAKFEETMRNAFWNPNEISMRIDANKFHQMPLPVQDAMCAIWFYQTLMDSAQNRGIEETLADFVTSSEWECLFKTWGYFELIHSISYSHIIRGIFSVASEVFDKNIMNENIKKRVESEINKYNHLAQSDIPDNEDGYKEILELILAIYALEGIKFYASFLITYLINDNYDSIPGATRIIKLINFDEDMHTKASVRLLKALKDEERFTKLLASDWFKAKAQEVFKSVYDDECTWASYVLELGEISFISKQEIHRFLQYYVDLRLRDIGVPELFNQPETDTIRWFKNYKNLNLENVALQESDLAVYNIGTLTNDW